MKGSRLLTGRPSLRDGEDIIQCDLLELSGRVHSDLLYMRQ